MDFGFAPGSDSHSGDLRSMFELRPNTRLVKVKRGLASVHDLIQHLGTSSSVTRPIDNILLGMHANDEGQLKIPLFAGQGDAWAKFEDLERSLADPKKSVAITDATIGFTAGDPITHAVHLNGCNIGLAPKFLVKLKEALGGNVNVSAPKFMHGATPAPQGVFEYLGYYFALRRPELFPNDPTTRKPDRAMALSEFDTAQFPLIDGTTVVPKADWDKIIPANPNQEIRKQVVSNLGASFGSRTTVKTPWQYRVTPIRFPSRGAWTLKYPTPADVPKDPFDQELDLKIDLKKDPRFQVTHPFPQWEREGFADLDSFMSGYKWNCVARGNTLACTGTRFMFILVVAVNDLATRPPTGIFTDGNLLFNFYPKPSSGLSAITNVIEVTNTKLFAQV